jgi:hypothetical protein
MGGTGSNRWKGYCRRKTVSEVPSLPALRVARALDRKPEGGELVAVEVREPVEASVCLEMQRRQWGPPIPWLLCPDCGHRRRVLYFDGRVSCRHCLNLGYDSWLFPRNVAPILRAPMVAKKAEARRAALNEYKRQWKAYRGEPSQIGTMSPISPPLAGFHRLGQASDSAPTR